ncbi:MAG TPA: alkaline phosphatase [Kofleriaceae bacterium]|nr:alkaline phosphatase [Kofleriaceae bacterium]
MRHALWVVALVACGDNTKLEDQLPPDPPRPDAAEPPPADADKPVTGARNIIFFLGDGMGVATQTAARIYAYGEAGQLVMDTLPETAWVRTYSNDALVTDSAPSMAAYMTGVKMNNEVLSMSADTVAVPPGGGNTIDHCGAANGTPVATFLEQAIAAHRAVGVVTTTRVTHATPAATYAHICHRDLENAIAAQLVPEGDGYNARLRDGVDVVFGGGRRHFLPTTAGGSRTDGRDLVGELQAHGYAYASTRAQFAAIDPATTKRAVGLFTGSHMSYELDRDPSAEPSLAEMTVKAMAILERQQQGYFLVVEGGRIDHALHETNARRALVDTVAFDAAIGAALAKARETDPDLSHTLIVVTADHDHTMTLNGYAKRTGATTASNAGVLGVVKDPVTGTPAVDAEGQPYAILGFGNGEKRVGGARSSVTALTDVDAMAPGFHQEAAVRMPAGGETHGGTDVALMAIGHGADTFHGFLTNTRVYDLLHAAAGF